MGIVTLLLMPTKTASPAKAGVQRRRGALQSNHLPSVSKIVLIEKKMLAVVLAFCLACPLLSTNPAPADGDAAHDVEQALSDFLAVALPSDAGRFDGISKWKGEVRYSFVETGGNPLLFGIVRQQTMSALAPPANLSIREATSPDGHEANFTFFFVGLSSRDEFVEERQSNAERRAVLDEWLSPKETCALYLIRSNGVIDGAEIYVKADRGPAEMQHCINQSAVQALGLLYTADIDDSVLSTNAFRGSSLITDRDKMFLRVLYSEAVVPGMRRKEVSTVAGELLEVELR